jgi:hypothetical protein
LTDPAFPEFDARAKAEEMRRIELFAVLFVLCAAVVLGSVVRARSVRLFDGDEAPAFLAAACQQREVARILETNAPPVGHWVSTRVWRDYMRPKQVFCLGEISAGLAETDRHPPLYFWILHFWLLVFEPSLPAALALNACFALATAGLLYALGVRLFGRPIAAAVSVFVWVVNPRTIETTQLARHYQLFGLVCVLFCWTLVREVQRSERRGWRDGVPLALASFAGLLTHYQFVFVAAAGGVYALWSLGLKKSLPAALGVGVGVLATNLVHPTFRSMLGGPSVGPPEALERARSTGRVLGEATEFLAYALRGLAKHAMRHDVAHAVTACFLIAAIAAAFWVRRSGRACDARFLVVPVLLLAQMLAVQRLGLAPNHMGYPRHLSALQPLLALLPGYLLAAAPGPTRELLAAGATALIVAVASLGSLTKGANLQAKRSREIEATCSRVIVPSAGRRTILSRAFVLSDKVQMLAGKRAALDAALEQVKGQPVCMQQSGTPPLARKQLARHGVPVRAELDEDFRIHPPKRAERAERSAPTERADGE